MTSVFTPGHPPDRLVDRRLLRRRRNIELTERVRCAAPVHLAEREPQSDVEKPPHEAHVMTTDLGRNSERFLVPFPGVVGLAAPGEELGAHLQALTELVAIIRHPRQILGDVEERLDL